MPELALPSPADPITGALQQPRPLVPSARQIAAGDPGAGPDVPSPPVTQQERIPLRRRLSAVMAVLDLRDMRGPKTPLVVFALLGLLTTADDLTLPLVLPEITTEFAVSGGPLLFLGQMLGLLGLLLMPVYGWLADRVNRVVLIRVVAIGANFIAAAVGFAGSYLQLAAMIALVGTLNLALLAPRATVLSDYYRQDELARLLPLFQAAAQAPVIVAPALAGLLVNAVGWRSGLTILGSVAALVSLVTFLLREPVRGGLELEDAGIEAPPEPPKPLGFAESWRALRGIRTVSGLWYATPFVYGGVFGIALYQPLHFAQQFGLSAGQIGFIYSLQGIVLVLGTLYLSSLLPRLMRYQPGRVLSLGAAFLLVDAAAVTVLLVSDSLVVSILAVLPILLVTSSMLPPFGLFFQLMTLYVVPPRLRGAGVSSSAPFGVVGLILASLAPQAIGTTQPLLVLLPFLLLAAYLVARTAPMVAGDIRTAKATALAEAESVRAQRDGGAKMLVCRGIEVHYDGTQVLFGVDFDVDVGEIVALLGTNGAGKSTILRAIAGIQPASGGAVLLDGLDITTEPAHLNAARGIVMMPGGHAIFPSLTVRQNLRAAAWLYRKDEAYVAARTEEVLEFFPRLRERLDQVAGTLSGGEQQMVALGQAFLLKPRLLMIDELSLGLAPSVVEQLLTILRAIHAENTTSIVLVEQSLNVAMTIADRAVFMDKGQIRFDGPTDSLLERPDLIRSVFMGGATTGKSLTSPRRPDSGGTSAPPVLRVEEVGVSFGGVRALAGVSLQLLPGEIVGIIGPNGAGKTTLFDVISGFVRADEGRLHLADTEVTGLPPDARALLGLGRSFQNVRLFPSITVRENIAVALEQRASKNPLLALARLPQHRRAEERIYRRVDGLVELLGLTAFRDKFVGELSTGSRRAVEVACLLASAPSALLLDEPSSGLAQAETEELGPVLDRVVRETGCGMLVIEHDMPLITSISTRMIAMELGSVIASGAPHEVTGSPAVVASYLAASPDVIQRSGRVAAMAAAVGQA